MHHEGMRVLDGITPVLQFACTALFFAIAIQLIRTKTAWLLPFFTALCVISGIHLAFWSPHAHTVFYVMEPLTIALRICAAIEVLLFAVRRLPRKESIGILIMLAGLGAAAAFIVWGTIAASDEMFPYKAVRLEVHTFLSMALAFGIMAMLIKPVYFPRFEITHGSILTTYLLKFAVIELVRGRHVAEDAFYYNWLLIGMVWTFVCCSAWLTLLLRGKR